MNAVEPVEFTFADGEKRDLLLTAAGLKRAMKQHGIDDPGEAASFEVLSTIIYQSLGRKVCTEMTEEAFEELLPFNVATLRDLVEELTGTQGMRPPEAQPVQIKSAANLAATG